MSLTVSFLGTLTSYRVVVVVVEEEEEEEDVGKEYGQHI